jgi:hypothetical protein
VIESELGLPLSAVFSSFSPSPVAAASLGQVYRGTLASTGAEVAVKVPVKGDTPVAPHAACCCTTITRQSPLFIGMSTARALLLPIGGRGAVCYIPDGAFA